MIGTKKILILIREINNSFSELGNKESWPNWIDGFGEIIRKNEKITDVEKKYFLSGILENIVVNYDYEEKLHRLNINFKLPVIIEEAIKKGEKTPALYKSKSKIYNKLVHQAGTVLPYSTVTLFARFLG